MNLPILDIWTFHCNENSLCKSNRSNVVYCFLNILNKDCHHNWDRAADEIETLERIHNFQRLALWPTIKQELTGYLKSTEVMALIISSTLSRSYRSLHMMTSNYLPTLLQLSSETCLLDEQSLNLVDYFGGSTSLISDHYCDLVSALLKPSDYVPVALRILAFLCSKPPHPIRYFKLSRPYSCPTLTSYATYQKRRRSVPYSRLRRQEKHCHGVRLSLSNYRGIGAGAKSWKYTGPYRSGFYYLPLVLEECPKSDELIAFVYTHGKNIGFSPGKTRVAVNAMHKYLDRVNQDVEMVEPEKTTS